MAASYSSCWRDVCSPHLNLARELLHPSLMTNGANLVTLARLHAALDQVVELEQLIATIQDTSGAPRTVHHVGDLLGQARELLRFMLTPVGLPGSGR
jgi:hypothetical protein